MNFFNGTNAKKTSNTGNSVIDVTTSQTIGSDADWKKNNLSWAESSNGTQTDSKKIIVEEDYFDSESVPQVKDLINPNQERSIASIFGGNYSGSNQKTVIVALVEALEIFPTPVEIARQRDIHEQNIAKLQKAKTVLSAVSTIDQNVNTDAVKAYTATEAALNEAINIRDEFESKLRSQSQSIKQLIANCGNTPENEARAQAIVGLYEFNEVT